MELLGEHHRGRRLQLHDDPIVVAATAGGVTRPPLGRVDHQKSISHQRVSGLSLIGDDRDRVRLREADLDPIERQRACRPLATSSIKVLTSSSRREFVVGSPGWSGFGEAKQPLHIARDHCPEVLVKREGDVVALGQKLSTHRDERT
jgi:hypothetical protein